MGAKRFGSAAGAIIGRVLAWLAATGMLAILRRFVAAERFMAAKAGAGETESSGRLIEPLVGARLLEYRPSDVQLGSCRAVSFPQFTATTIRSGADPAKPDTGGRNISSI